MWRSPGGWCCPPCSSTTWLWGPLTIGYNAGDTDNYSWYRLGGFTFQPTELAKISFILTFAMHLNNVRSRINEPRELAKLLAHLMAPILLTPTSRATTAPPSSTASLAAA